MRALIFLIALPLFSAAETLPDPTRPFGYALEPVVIVQEAMLPRELATWNLTGIRITEQDRLAVLNGKLLREGDQVDGAELVAINPGSILIDFENRRTRIDLLPLEIKQSSTIDTTRNSELPVAEGEIK